MQLYRKVTGLFAWAGGLAFITAREELVETVFRHTILGWVGMDAFMMLVVVCVRTFKASRSPRHRHAGYSTTSTLQAYIAILVVLVLAQVLAYKYDLSRFTTACLHRRMWICHGFEGHTQLEELVGYYPIRQCGCRDRLDGPQRRYLCFGKSTVLGDRSGGRREGFESGSSRRILRLFMMVHVYAS